MPAQILDAQNPQTRGVALEHALSAITNGHLVVLPTDTVYGIGCDAFSPAAVAGLLQAKGRGRGMPPPVLVSDPDDVIRLVETIPSSAKAVMAEFWPGGVTIIFRAHPSVSWDLGDTEGTVAIRMPDHAVALELLELTGPLAVSSANLTGLEPAVSAQEALAQLGDRVEVYLDGGPVGDGYRNASAGSGSTIVDASTLDHGGAWRVVRHGVVPVEDIHAVAGGRWEL